LCCHNLCAKSREFPSSLRSSGSRSANIVFTPKSPKGDLVRTKLKTDPLIEIQQFV
jgi:hypothetical protein